MVASGWGMGNKDCEDRKKNMDEKAKEKRRSSPEREQGDKGKDSKKNTHPTAKRRKVAAMRS